MPKAKIAVWTRGKSPNRRVIRVGNRIVMDHGRRSPFLHGMAKAIDVGGLLREADVVSARRTRCRRMEELQRSSVDTLAIDEAWGAVGGYFQRVIGSPAGRTTAVEAANE